jgi:hypothetical protein
MTVAILFARADSIYKTLADCDVWDADRDALKWQGGSPVVAHPPCRAWGRLRHFAKPRAGERSLSLWAVDMVRRWGGVLEHPASSLLWKEKPLPGPGNIDEWGGWTLPVLQMWWGHRAEKRTWLYVCGVEPSRIPEIPLKLGAAECVIRLDKRRRDGTHIRKGDKDWRPFLNDAERERTPRDFAEWLVELASRTQPSVVASNNP